ncbi:MAG: hypothetical protein FWG64_00200, partial [Firmicutes bacterium]|nr:hypothetical protein [Bacillota bacterium]
EQSRAEQSRAEQSRAEQSRAEQSSSLIHAFLSTAKILTTYKKQAVFFALRELLACFFVVQN